MSRQPARKRGPIGKPRSSRRSVGLDKAAHARGLAERARSLRAAWNRLTQHHVIVGAACSCGGTAGHIQRAEIEDGLIAYLRAKYPDAAQILDPDQSQTLTVDVLLERLAGRLLANAAAMALLLDIERTLESVDDLRR